MGSADNLVAAILENFKELLPFRIIHANEQGVRWTCGRASPALEMGWYWFCPVLQSIDVVDVTVGSIDLSPQVIRTQDGVQCAIHMGVEYRVVDARKYLVELSDEDAIDTIQNLSRGLVTQVMSKYLYRDLWETKRRATQAIKTEIREKVEDWGIAIVAVYLHEYPELKSYMLYHQGER